MNAALALLQRTFPAADVTAQRLYRAQIGGGRWQTIAADDVSDALRVAQRDGPVTDLQEITR